jgi:hypothetical protein
MIVVGESEDSDGLMTMNIAKIDASNGELIWQWNYGDSLGHQSAEKVAFTSDGGFIITGHYD